MIYEWLDKLYSIDYSNKNEIEIKVQLTPFGVCIKALQTSILQTKCQFSDFQGQFDQINSL